MKSICVFCGSTMGRNPEFEKVAHQLGKTLAQQKISLVYGGSNVGLMGAVADGALENGGEVIGVLPRFLESKEVAHRNLTKLILCETMHERKKAMFEQSEGFIALPGGFGTLEEVVEVLTWQQLDLHHFPIGFLNVAGYYDHLKAFFNHMEASELLKPDHNAMALFAETTGQLLEMMKNYKPSHGPKVIQPGKT